MRISRSLGVDLVTGTGLDDALTGVDAVVDTSNATATGGDEMVTYFGTTRVSNAGDLRVQRR